MQFSKLFFTALSLAFAQTVVAAPGSHAPAAASKYLSFLDLYRLENPGLSPEQVTAIDSMSDLAINLDSLTPEAEAAVRKAAIDAFGHDDGMALLNPSYKTANEKRGARMECDCADAAAFCPNGWECKKGYAKCKKTWGCGFGGIYDCDGICID